MIVRCANCHTEFSLDDQQIGPEGATVRCSVCSYVFPVDPPAGSGDQPWQIRTIEDLLFSAPDLSTLRAWIDEGRLHPDDQVSRTGRHWLRLGDMPEFSSAFLGFTDLPQVFEELEPPPAAPAGAPVSAQELGPPPSFGGTMPVIQGVDTDILVVDSPAADFVRDEGVDVVVRQPAVEREPPLSPVDSASEASGPMPFPLAEVDVEELEEDDESAARLRPRPRPDSLTARVHAIPDVIEDEPVEPVRHRAPRPTVRYGLEDLYPLEDGQGVSSMLDAVTHRVDEQAVEAESAEVRSPAVAVERDPVRPREASGKRPSAALAQPPPPPPPPSRPSPAIEELSSSELEELPKRRRVWPLLAGLGLLAGVAIVFGVPSIRARVMEFAGQLVGGERFDPSQLAELEQARTASASLDPVAMGEAEAALQGRIDSGGVPAAGIAEMKIAQVELLATRAIEAEIRGVVDVDDEARAGPDDVERATRIFAAVVADDVRDRANMRRVRARLRLAQGQPESGILPLLPDEGSQELRELVVAAALWRDPNARVPAGAIEGLEGLPSRTALAELALALAYLRAGDETGALKVAQRLLDAVPNHPTALALKAEIASVAGRTEAPEDDGGSGSESGGEEAEGSGDESGQGTTGADEAAEPKPKKPVVRSESVDSLIERGCDLVESGKVSEGLEALRKAAARRPSDLDAKLCIGLGQARKGRTRDALGTFEGILGTSPSFAPAVRNAAKAAAKLGQTEKAVGYYRTLLGLRPRDPKALAYVEANG